MDHIKIPQPYDLLSSKPISIPSKPTVKKNFFRPINYLGSKLRMLDFIGEVIDDLAAPEGIICDLFAGSGSVSRYISSSRTVISSDIQEYSRVICSALLNPHNDIDIDEFVDDCLKSETHKVLLSVCAEICEYELECIDLALDGLPSALCEFLEEASLIKSQDEGYRNCSTKLEKALKNTNAGIRKSGYDKNSNAIATLYFGGIYFSFAQTIAIDTILNEIQQRPPEEQDTLLAALLGTASNVVNTVGKQFAQPIQPRAANGLPKKGIGARAEKDRSINVFSDFKEMLRKYTTLEKSNLPHLSMRMDFSDALDALPQGVSVVYADPPYTRDHYSRFYHVLETLCLRDSPEISKTKLHGNIQFSRGLYREDRHQSPFCIRSLAPSAFSILFEKTSNLGASLVLSYSPFINKEGEHPRVMTINDLTELAQTHFKHVITMCPGEFKHNKLNSRANSFEEKTHGEILIVCKN